MTAIGKVERRRVILVGTKAREQCERGGEGEDAVGL